MVKKRLIGVITIKDGWAVQSFGYKRYLPLGRPETIAENFDRWGADEILVISIDRSLNGLGPDYDVIKRISHTSLTTPLAYGGGISSVDQANSVIQLGVERVCVDALVHNDLSTIQQISFFLGYQAVIASLPLSIEKDTLYWYDYIKMTKKEVNKDLQNFLKGKFVSEALIIDWKNEGNKNSFDTNIISKFPFSKASLIVFGGISQSNQIDNLLRYDSVAAVAIGNFLNYNEHAIQVYKDSLKLDCIRSSTYALKFS